MKRKRKTFRKILLAFGVVVTICGVMSLIGLYIIAESIGTLGEWLSYDGGCLEWWGGPTDPAAIEEGANLILPPSTENLFAHSVAFQDCFVFVSFDMASADLDSFLTSTYVSELSSVTGSQLIPIMFESVMQKRAPVGLLKYMTPIFMIGITTFINLLQNDVDWTFDDETVYLHGKGSSESGLSSQSIVIARRSPDTYTVYVVTFLS